MLNGTKTLINLTPHWLNIIKSDGTIENIPPSGIVCRADTATTTLGIVNGIEISQLECGRVYNLPLPMPNTMFIVSERAAKAIFNRDDILIPGLVKKNKNGKPIGCYGLTKLSQYGRQIKDVIKTNGVAM